MPIKASGAANLNARKDHVGSGSIINLPASPTMHNIMATPRNIIETRRLVVSVISLLAQIGSENSSLLLSQPLVMSQ